MGNIKTVTITYTSLDPEHPLYAPKGGTDLNKGDTITLQLASNFPIGSNINTIEIFNNIVIDGVDHKDKHSPVGSWTMQGGNDGGLSGKFSCSAASWTNVTIEDIEDNDDDIKYWYSAGGAVGSSGETWSIDPELINKGKPTVDIHVEPQSQQRVES